MKGGSENDTGRFRIVIALLAAQVLLLVLIGALVLGIGSRRHDVAGASERILDRLDGLLEETREVLAETASAQEGINRLVERTSANTRRLEDVVGDYDRLVRRQAELLSLSLRPQIEIELFAQDGKEQIVISNPGKPLSSLTAKAYGYLSLTLAEEEAAGLRTFDIPYYNYYRLPEYDSLLSGEMVRIESWAFAGSRLSPQEAVEALRRTRPQGRGAVLVAVRFERYVFLEYTDQAQRESSEMYFVDPDREYRVDPVKARELTESYVSYRKYEDVFSQDEGRERRLAELWAELLDRMEAE